MSEAAVATTKRWREQMETLFQNPVRPSEPALPEWSDDVTVASNRFLVLYKGRADSATIGAAILQIQGGQSALPQSYKPLLVVPYMTAVGANLCKQYGVSWLDLAGNAHIIGANHIINIRGVGQAPKERGRPQSPFAPQASAVVHDLLLNAPEPVLQRTIAHRTGLNEGYVSRLVRRLKEMEYVSRSPQGVKVIHPELLLNAWAENRSLPQKQIVKGVIPSRSGSETVGLLAEQLQKAGIDYGVTGLAAAWKYDGFADYRLVTAYIIGELPADALAKIGFIKVDRGANVWLIPDVTENHLLGSRVIEGVKTVSPIMTYVDLKLQPERAEEAAKHLYTHVIKGLWNGEF